MMDAGEAKARALLKDMGHWDFDRQEIAGYDLALLIESTKLPSDLLQSALDSYINQLTSESVYVQSNSLKCAARVLVAVG
jgi:hypothetical protein